MKEQHFDYAGTESSYNKHQIWDSYKFIFQIQMIRYLLNQ